MRASHLFFSIFFYTGSLSHQRSTVDDPDFVIGIVEFTPELPTVNWGLRTGLHFDNYSRIITDAAEQDVDILVFPEYTLNNAAFPVEVSDPLDSDNPCLEPGSHDNLIIDLSCLARQNEIYLCINLIEREHCTDELQAERNDSRPCSSLGFSRFNTNVIFDRNGTIVGRYRKFNLFREGGINSTLTAERSTFETDFGVTFGNIICFDILFFEPAMQIVQMGVKNFIFPAMWTSELPFLTSNQIYQSWAYRNNLNVFAAGANFALAVATGTGFFLGRSGSPFTVFTENPIRDVFILRVPKDPSDNSRPIEDVPEPITNSFRSMNFGRDVIDEFVTELIDFTSDETIEKEFCHDAHCCSFSIDYEKPASNESFQYRLVSFNGDRTYSGWGDKKLIICAVMVCNDETLDSCGRMPDPDLNHVTFKSIEISTEFHRFGVLMMPNSLDLNMNPLKVSEFSYDEVVISKLLKKSSISLLQPHSDIQAFALYGHDYEVEDEFKFDGSGDDFGSGLESGESFEYFL